MEATRPAIPPPTTQKSASSVICGKFFIDKDIFIASCLFELANIT
ncbi:MAG: hypothetical protein ACW98D_08825 [Promethearchaeota archaeon]